MTKWASEAVGLIGAGCIIFGVSRWSTAAAWVVSGTLLMALAWMVAAFGAAGSGGPTVKDDHDS